MAAKKKEKEEIVLKKGENVRDALISHFEKAYGEGDLVALSDDVISSVSEFIDTGSDELNQIVSNGRGWPVGKIVTILGLKSSGKSTLAAHLLAAAQKAGAITILLDSECAFDSDRAKIIGVNTDELLSSVPRHMEETLEKIEKCIEFARASNKLVVIVWDSVAATPTRGEVEGEIGEGAHYGQHSKILSAGFRKLMGLVSKNRVLLYVVNQIKTKINAKPWESPETIIGQLPLEFHSHVMIRIAQCGKIEDSDENAIGIMSRIKVVKNRVAPPFRECEIPIMFDIGVDRCREALAIGKRNRRAKQHGAFQQVATDCTMCNGLGFTQDGKKKEGCDNCKSSGIVQDERFPGFYEKDVREFLTENPAVREYFINGTPIPIITEAIKQVQELGEDVQKTIKKKKVELAETAKV